jgi:hypothetical protein
VDDEVDGAADDVDADVSANKFAVGLMIELSSVSSIAVQVRPTTTFNSGLKLLSLRPLGWEGSCSVFLFDGDS